MVLPPSNQRIEQLSPAPCSLLRRRYPTTPPPSSLHRSSEGQRSMMGSAPIGCHLKGGKGEVGGRSLREPPLLPPPSSLLFPSSESSRCSSLQASFGVFVPASSSPPHGGWLPPHNLLPSPFTPPSSCSSSRPPSLQPRCTVPCANPSSPPPPPSSSLSSLPPRGLTLPTTAAEACLAPASYLFPPPPTLALHHKPLQSQFNSLLPFPPFPFQFKGPFIANPFTTMKAMQCVGKALAAPKGTARWFQTSSMASGVRRVQSPGDSAIRRVTVLPGHGIGPEIVTAAQRVVDATNAPIEWDVVDNIVDRLTPEALDSLTRNKVCLKGEFDIGKVMTAVLVFLYHWYEWSLLMQALAVTACLPSMLPFAKSSTFMPMLCTPSPLRVSPSTTCRE